ncbi:hypothetical protein Tco_0198971 [Tanacetum coccineum]
MTKVTDLEANLEQFKIEQAAIKSEAAKQLALLQATIDRNKVEADRQFAEIMNAFKALQPPTTLPAIIPRFEENSGQRFSSDEVEKEELILMSMDKGDVTGPILAVKEDLGQKLIDDLDEPLMVLESDGMINKNEFAVVSPIVAVAPIVVAPIAIAPFVVAPIAVAPVVVAPVEPSFVPLGRKIKHNQAEQKWGCEICLQERVPAQRRTWDPGITHGDILKQHLEDKEENDQSSNANADITRAGDTNSEKAKMISHEEDGRREGSWEGSKRSGLIGMAELLRVILPEMSDLLNRILVQLFVETCGKTVGKKCGKLVGKECQIFVANQSEDVCGKSVGNNCGNFVEIRGKWPLSTGFLTDSTVGKSSLCGSDGRVIEAPMA